MVKTLLIQLEICGTTNWIVLNEKKKPSSWCGKKLSCHFEIPVE